MDEKNGRYFKHRRRSDRTFWDFILRFACFNPTIKLKNMLSVFDKWCELPRILSLASQQSILFFTTYKMIWLFLFTFPIRYFEMIAPVKFVWKSFITGILMECYIDRLRVSFPRSYYTDIDKKSLHFSTFHLRFICAPPFIPSTSSH